MLLRHDPGVPSPYEPPAGRIVVTEDEMKRVDEHPAVIAARRHLARCGLDKQAIDEASSLVVIHSHPS